VKYEKEYAVIVAGAGHAGIEAALVCARLGLSTLLLTLNLDTIGKMSCNPAIGGPGKSQLVRELDALGGEMARAADATFLQLKMLNLSKGPAVHSLRAQSDRTEYVRYMKRLIENTANLDVKQAEVTELIMDGEKFQGVKTKMGFDYYARALVLTTGTFLCGEIYIGLDSTPAGRAGEFPASELTASLHANGIRTNRLKTGTPPRIDRRTIDFSKVREEPGLEKEHFFSFETTGSLRPQQPCYLVRTNQETHQIIRDNLDRSPMYQGMIHATGARYCPSIEDKVVKFADRDSHHLFIEPEGVDTNEMYVQGFSSSLPYDVQLKALRTVAGLENVEITRPAYAIAYDFIFPEQIDRSLKIKSLTGVYSAGQINGTSGYEEAAVQGFVAGVNAAHFVLGKEPFALTREESYIGTLIDDLITKEIREPYRMMTSRSEYRLFLRQDNAEDRLLVKGKELGLISEMRWQTYQESRKKIDEEKAKLKKFKTQGTNAYELLKRPQVKLADIADYTIALTPLEIEKLEIEIKYGGYLDDIQTQIGRAQEAEKRKLPKDADYLSIQGLRKEAREKLQKVQPDTIGQASRIAGVNPADIAVLLIWLEKIRRNNE